MPDVPPKKHLRVQLEELDQKERWELLKNLISLNKYNQFCYHIRTIRALEVFYVTGQPLSIQKIQKPLNGGSLNLD